MSIIDAILRRQKIVSLVLITVPLFSIASVLALQLFSSQKPEILGDSTIQPLAGSDDVTITKAVDKQDVQRDDPTPGAQDVAYTITVTVNGCETLPIDSMLVFDRSNSMNDPIAGDGTPDKLSIATQATISFINELDPTEDQTGLASYSNNATLNHTLVGGDFTNVIATVSGISAAGFTNIGDGIEVASLEAQSVRANPLADPVIVIFSDGVANRPFNEGVEDLEFAQNYALQKANNAKAAGIRIIAVSFGEDADDALMTQIASAPGDFYDVNNEVALEQTFIEIAQKLKSDSIGLVVEDDISDILQYADLGTIPPGATFDNGVLSWDLGEIACDAQITLPFTVTVKPDAPDLSQLLNSATAISDQDDTFESNEVETTIHAPILELSKTDNQDTVSINEVLSYVIHVRNIGTGNAYNVVLNENFPVQIIPQENTLDPAGVIQQSTVIWDNSGSGYILDGTFDPTGSLMGSEGNFAFQALVDPGAPPSSSIVNSVVLGTTNGTIISGSDVTIINDYSGLDDDPVDPVIEEPVISTDPDLLTPPEKLAETGQDNIILWQLAGLMLIFSAIGLYILSKQSAVKKQLSPSHE